MMLDFTIPGQMRATCGALTVAVTWSRQPCRSEEGGCA